MHNSDNSVQKEVLIFFYVDLKFISNSTLKRNLRIGFSENLTLKTTVENSIFYIGQF